MWTRTLGGRGKDKNSVEGSGVFFTIFDTHSVMCVIITILFTYVNTCIDKIDQKI